MTDGLTDAIDFRAVLDVLGDQITIVGIDGRILWANQRARHVLNRPLRDMVGRDALSLLHPEDREAASRALSDSVNHPGDQVTIELRADDGRGDWVPLEFIGSMILGSQTSATPMFVLASRSLRWRWSAREAAALIGRGARLSVVVQQLAKFAAEMLEVDSAIVRWGTEVGRFGPEHAAFRYHTVDLFEDADVATLSVAFDQSYRPWTSDHRAFREISRMATVLRQREKDQARLRHLATHDDLTGFDNRRATADRLYEGAAAGAVSVLFVDLDGFKLVNDSLGHDVGDTVLQLAAARLLAAVAGRGAVGRYGGDEFVVVIGGPPELATQCAGDIVQQFREPLQNEDRSLTLTVSVGIAHTGANLGDLRPVVEALVRDAGTALHQAKIEGRDRWTLFHVGLRRTVVERLETTQAVRRAFEEDGIRLHYQPQFDVETGQIVGFEALLRWLGPDGQPSLPAHFLRVAGEMGLFSQLSRRTLIGACRQLAHWRTLTPDAAQWFVGVNLSPAEVDDFGIVDLVDEAIESAGLQPSDVQLEIVEHAFAVDGRGLRNLMALHQRGVGLAIDDFGVGESSLARLRDLPIDTLKIDRSLITGVLDDRASHAIASSIATLGHGLGVIVVAEGIETAADLAGAREIGCHRVQGFHLGYPMPPELAIGR